MTLYRKDTLISSKLGALSYPSIPEAYELRLIDDDGDKNSFKPFYEVGALDRRERVGDYDSLAFVQSRSYRPPAKAAGGDLQITPEEIEELKKLNVRDFIKLNESIETDDDSAGKHEFAENQAQNRSQ